MSYPPRFNPHEFHHPAMWAQLPQEGLEEVEDLFSQDESYSLLFSLEEDIRQAYPTTTHIYIEKISGRRDDADTIKATFQRRTTRPNPNYEAEMAQYRALQKEMAQARAAWEADVGRWKAEVKASKDAADYKVYLELKARYLELKARFEAK